MRNAFLMTGLVVALTACADVATQPDLAGPVFAGPVFARPGSGLPSNTSATFTLGGGMGGNPQHDASNLYVDGACAVTATIFYNNGGNDGILNLNLKPSTCVRGFSLTYIKDGTSVTRTTGHSIGVINMGSVLDGQTLDRQFGFGLTGTGCARIQFPLGGSNTVARVGTTIGSVFTVNGSGSVRCLDSKGNTVAGTYTATASFTVTQGNPK